MATSMATSIGKQRKAMLLLTLLVLCTLVAYVLNDASVSGCLEQHTTLKGQKDPSNQTEEAAPLNWLSEDACLAQQGSLPRTSQVWMTQMKQVRKTLYQSGAAKKFRSRKGKTTELGPILDQVLSLMSPDRLRRSIRPVNPELHFHQMRRIHQKLLELMENPLEAPKVQILVFGGSVTTGAKSGRTGKFPVGAWPDHLAELINHFLGWDAVQVVNLAIGATRSNMATSMLNYGLLPPTMQQDGPDVIINAYSVNDFSLFAENPREGYNRAFKEHMESLSRYWNCEGAHHDKPLVLFLNDLILNNVGPDGTNETRSLYYSESFNSEMAKLAQWYGVWMVSYSDVVRDWAYRRGPEEELLMDLAEDRMHPPWAGHVAMALTIFYNVVHATLEFCQDLSVQSTASRLTHVPPSTEKLWLDPRLRPSLPSATDTSSLEHEWERKQREWKCHGQGQDACSFAWIAARGVHDKLSLPNIYSVIVDSKGWSYETDGYNLHQGLEAQEANATVVLKVDVNNPRKKNVLDLFYMKSYSEKWEGSLVEGSIHVGSLDASPVQSFQLSGFQETRTSEYFPHKQNFVTSGLQTPVFIHLKLIGGSTFKIGGLAVCSQEAR